MGSGPGDRNSADFNGCSAGIGAWFQPIQAGSRFLVVIWLQCPDRHTGARLGFVWQHFLDGAHRRSKHALGKFAASAFHIPSGSGYHLVRRFYGAGVLDHRPVGGLCINTFWKFHRCGCTRRGGFGDRPVIQYW